MEQNGIHYDTQNPKKLDLEYHDKIKGIAYICLLVGGVFTLFGSIVGIFQNMNYKLMIIPYILQGTIFMFWSIYTWYALCYRKPNAVFLSRSLIIVSLITWLFSMLISFSLISLIGVIACCVGIVYTFNSDDINVVFPKEYRSCSALDILLLIGAIVLPSLSAIVVLLMSFTKF